MTEVLNPKVEATGIWDLLGMLIAKRVVDGVGLPVVGNNNIISGIAKLGIGAFLHGKGGRVGQIFTGGLILDGGDDLVGVGLGMFGGKLGGGGGHSNDPNLGAP